MSKTRKLLFFLFILQLYFFFPTTNSTNDAYAFAAYIRYGHTLAEPFHMLYNYLGFAVCRFLGLFFIPEVLATMKALNSIAAVICLFLLYRILRHLGKNDKQSIYWVLPIAFSFGVWRFGTENETYIFPIVFSLLASLQYLKYLEKTSTLRIVFISIWASVACLFHVIHFFWWFGLLLGVGYKSRKLMPVIFYLLPSVVVPFVYLTIIPVTQNCTLSYDCLWHFFAPVLTSDNVQYDIGTDNFYLGAINFFRTFYQVHGNMFFLVKKNLLFIAPGLLSIFLGLTAIFKLFRTRLVQKSRNDFILIHILIFSLQLLWAFYSKGNAEFMVMLPFLLSIVAAYHLKPDVKFLGWLTASFFIWNLSYGILPNHFADFNKREKLLTRIMTDKRSTYLLEHGKEVQNQIFYHTGEEDMTRVMKLPKNKTELDSIILSAKKSGTSVYTDFYNQTKVINRYIMTVKENSTFMDSLKYIKVDSFQNFYGVNYIYRIIW